MNESDSGEETERVNDKPFEWEEAEDAERRQSKTERARLWDWEEDGVWDWEEEAKVWEEAGVTNFEVSKALGLS